MKEILTSTKKFRMPSRIIWAAMLVSTLFYVFISLLLSEGTVKFEPQEFKNQVVQVLYAVALLDIFFILFALDRILTDTSSQGIYIKYIARWVLIESIVIYGLIASFITRNSIHVIITFGVGTALFIVYHPFSETFEKTPPQEPGDFKPIEPS